MKRGAIILCGGQSSRMGVPKWSLPFGPETMLERVVRLVGTVCEPLVLVRAAGQVLPAFGKQIIIAEDARPDRGPLEGIAAGLAALPDQVEAAYVTTCDAPLVVPAFIERLFELLGDESAVAPVHEGFVYPLSAVYRTRLLDVVSTLLEADRLRPSDLFDLVATRRVSSQELRDVDPRLDTLKNLNTPEEYLTALAQAGFTAPP
ncbi:MAG TPA: molybdenum cofactor guanylyltransferase [Pirellulales bacterium]|jgi:molybdopterin-guanine dinucleotide biosynthesis protein A|nr:molybdenum cofactor guanylyltransferase [Pirellulales bacterium]